MKQTYTRLTLEDISKEINISRTTIYKVINNKGNVNDSTRKAVMEALRKYNYVPNNNARNLAMNRRYTIAYIGFESVDAAYFAPAVEKGIRLAVRDYGDHGLVVESYSSPADVPDQQRKDIQQALDSGVRDFIIACADTEQMKPTLKELRDMGSSVILLSKHAGLDRCDAFIGIDDYKSGQLAAEILGSMVPPNGSLQILMAKESHSNVFSTRQKLEGFLAYCQAVYPNLTLLPVLENLGSPAALETDLTSVLEERKPDGICDFTYRLDIVAQILRQRGLKNIPLVGMDLFPELVPYLQDHTVNAVIFQNLKAQAYLACRLLFEKMCYGKDIAQKEYYSKLEIVMSGNMEYFLDNQYDSTQGL